MYLKTVEIFGFKSFAEKTKIKLHKGLNAIVGPNGCGKSNVAEAMRWVFGEQSRKSMRTDKMQDVIFSGTETRKPLGFAEVTLIFSESQGDLPIEFDEVSITRRYYRSGEGEYFINRRPVRLKDIQNLFWDTGIGKAAFSLFEQGKIDQMIRFSPQERRQIFDEASGIQRFLNRKKEALKKLQEIDANLFRLRDLYQEVSRELAVLEKQAEKATRYQKCQEEMIHLEKEKLYWDLKALNEQEKQLILDKDRTSTQLSLLESDSKKSQEKVTLLEKKLEDEGALKDQRKDQFFTLSAQIKTKSKEGVLYVKYLEEENQSQELLKTELEKLLNTDDLESLHLLELVEAKENLIRSLEDLEKQKEAINEQKKTEQHSLTQRQERYQDKQQQLYLSMKQISLLRENLKEAEREQQDIKKRQISIKDECEMLANRKQILCKTVECEQQKKEGELSQIRSLEKEHLDLKKTLKQQIEEKESINIVEKKLWEDIAGLSSKKELYSEWEKKQVGFSDATQKLLSESKKQGGQLYGNLRPLLSCLTPEKVDKAIFTLAFEIYTDTLVVDNTIALREVIRLSKSLKLSGFSLFCLEEAPLDELNSYFFENDPYSFVNEWGLYKDRKGVLFSLSNKENPAYGHFVELPKIVKELNKKKTKLSILEKKRESFENQIFQCENEIRKTDQTLRLMEMKRIESELKIKQQLEEIEKIDQTLQKIQLECELLDKKQPSYEENIREIKQSLGIAEIDQQKQEKELKESLLDARKCNERVTSYQLQQDVFDKKIVSIRSDIQKIVTKEQDAQSLQIKKTHLQERFERDLQESKRKAIKWKEEKKKNIEDVERLVGKEIAVKASLEESEKSVSELLKKRDAAFQELKALQEKTTENEFNLREKDKEYHLIQTRLKQMEDYCREELSITIDALLGLVPTVDQIRLSVEIEKKKRVLKNFQEINFTSIEAYQKQKERYEEVSKHMEDVEKSKKMILDMIQATERESKNLFMEVFSQIRTRFLQYFSELFHGGQADLILTDENILEAGIEIVAAPPGKKRHTLALMSGGEKCLTALALLFAIFSVKTSPFCILDEVDAPLDDANVDRFLKLLLPFSSTCQFIVITHNKKTMAKAHVLHGVTMEEKGVTKLISMNFDGAEKMTKVQSVY